MVIRPVKKITTVDINNEVYEPLKQKALTKRVPTKILINKLLKNSVDRENIMKQKYPTMSIFEVMDDRITLVNRDEKRNRDIIDLYLKNNILFCEAHKSETCEHTQFVRDCEISRILASTDVFDNEDVNSSN